MLCVTRGYWPRAVTADVIEFLIIQWSKTYAVFDISELGRCAFTGCCLSLTTSSVAMETI